MNNGDVNGEPTLRQILSVACPMCKAKPKEPCTVMTGHPSLKTHLSRGLAARKDARPDNAGQSILRILKNFGHSLPILFQHK